MRNAASATTSVGTISSPVSANSAPVSTISQRIDEFLRMSERPLFPAPAEPSSRTGPPPRWAAIASRVS
jgi:hypothetical protein